MVKSSVLVVDDEEGIREVLQALLEKDGYSVEVAHDGLSAKAFLVQKKFNIVITDMRMPRLGGVELLGFIRNESPETLVVMMTAYATAQDAVEAMKAGAFDYITKPFKNEHILSVVRRASEAVGVQQVRTSSSQEKGNKFGSLVGASVVMRELFALIDKVSPSQASVIIAGESGTGKELVAREIHSRGPAPSAPFLAINCAAIPETLLESELFGHEKGSFTGAVQQRLGIFESAANGTVFLDEIGEMPLAMQVKLLRVLQEREFMRVGGSRVVPVRARVLVATNRDLAREVREGRFREDLYYRLNVVTLVVPPLRNRMEDLELLIENILKDKEQQRGDELFSDQALACLRKYSWPGNVRELVNVVERATILCGTGLAGIEHLPASVKSRCMGFVEVNDLLDVEDFCLDNYLAEEESRLIKDALGRTNGMKGRAAELLGITFRSFRYRLKKLGLDDEQE